MDMMNIGVQDENKWFSFCEDSQTMEIGSLDVALMSFSHISQVPFKAEA